MIHHGELLYDGKLQSLASQFSPYKLLRVTVHDDSRIDALPLPTGVALVAHEENAWTLSVPQAEVPALAAHILNTFPVMDIAIEDPAIETVIDTIYSEGGVL